MEFSWNIEFIVCLLAMVYYLAYENELQYRISAKWNPRRKRIVGRTQNRNAETMGAVLMTLSPQFATSQMVMVQMLSAT